MKIFIGSDHAGFALKQELKVALSERHEVIDCGADSFDAGDDYPVYAFAVGENIQKNPDAVGILLCHNGVGMCVAANKVAGIRAVATTDTQIAKESRHDDDTNVLCLPAGYMDVTSAVAIVYAWMDTAVGEAERYHRRISQIEHYESK